MISAISLSYCNLIAGGDDQGNGDGAEEEETDEGEFLHSPSRDLQHQPCSMKTHLLPI